MTVRTPDLDGNLAFRAAPVVTGDELPFPVETARLHRAGFGSALTRDRLQGPFGGRSVRHREAGLACPLGEMHRIL